MDKGITFFYGFDYDIVKRAKDIKNAGFDCVMTVAEPVFNKQNGKIAKQVRLFKKNGLKLTSLHMRYRTAELPHFFMDDKIGEKIEKNLKKDLKIAKKYGFKCVVVHMKGEVTDVGLRRFERVLAESEKLGVPLALENLDANSELIKYFFDNYKSDFVKFCYDSGHNNCFYPNEDFLGEYGDRLICLHLHDNMGENDDHTLNEFGNIDWKKVANALSKCPEVSLDYELIFKKPCSYTYDVVLKKCYAQAVELEKMIENCKKSRKKQEKM